MTQDEIIRSPLGREQLVALAREVWGERAVLPFNELERFAALVAAHERNRHAWTQEHWTQYEHAIVAAEREACAKLFADEDCLFEGKHIAAAIRSRSSEH